MWPHLHINMNMKIDILPNALLFDKSHVCIKTNINEQSSRAITFRFIIVLIENYAQRTIAIGWCLYLR